MSWRAKVRLTACPFILFRSSQFSVAALVECERLNCGRSLERELVERVLTGGLDPLDVRGEERLLLYAILYGGLILAYRSDHYGFIPLARYQTGTGISVEESGDAPSTMGDQQLLELWARIIAEGPGGLCFRAFNARARICFNGGPCRLAPVGYEAWLAREQQD